MDRYGTAKVNGIDPEAYLPGAVKCIGDSGGKIWARDLKGNSNMEAKM